MLASDHTVCGKRIDTLKPSSERRVRLSCDDCGKVTESTFANYRRAQDKALWGKGVTICRKCASLRTGKTKRGRPSPRKGTKLPEGQRGVNHPMWRGGRFIDAHGYVMIYDHDAPRGRVGWEHYVKEHVAVMERHIGRGVVRGENVHHIDGNKQNNSIDNLYLCTNADHKQAHHSLQEIGYSLIRAGYIAFDRETGTYRATSEILSKLGLDNPAVAR